VQSHQRKWRTGGVLSSTIDLQSPMNSQLAFLTVAGALQEYSSEPGSVSFILLAGGVGKRMGVCLWTNNLIPQCCISTVQPCLWYKAATWHITTSCQLFLITKLHTAGKHSKAVSGAPWAAHCHVQPANSGVYARNWGSCHRL
jgi:hypothetical protein